MLKIKGRITALISVLVLSLMILASCGSERTVYYYNGFEYTVLDDGTLEIVGYSSKDTAVDIPDVIDSKIVTSIADNAFRDTDITSVALGSFTDKIGDSAFMGCTSLEKITGCEFLSEIGEYAFYDTAIKEIELGDYLTTVKKGAFARCDSLEKINIPTSVKKIASGVFSECSSLSEIGLHDGIKEIGDNAFYGCVSLALEDLELSAISIGERAFASCVSIKSVSIGPAAEKSESWLLTAVYLWKK